MPKMTDGGMGIKTKKRVNKKSKGEKENDRTEIAGAFKQHVSGREGQPAGTAYRQLV